MLAAGSSPVSGLVFTVAVLATSMALVAALAWASRRLLGLSVGVLRALIAGPSDALLVSSPCYVGITGAARLLDIEPTAVEMDGRCELL